MQNIKKKPDFCKFEKIKKKGNKKAKNVLKNQKTQN